jgi:hypothetical protein
MSNSVNNVSLHLMVKSPDFCFAMIGMIPVHPDSVKHRFPIPRRRSGFRLRAHGRKTPQLAEKIFSLYTACFPSQRKSGGAQNWTGVLSEGS